MWPGVSRAGASIMAGMALGLTPRVATEFSFYLAIPTMLGAAARTLWKYRHDLTPDVATIVIAGSATAFVVALVVVAAFMGYVRRYRFTPFAIYRVVLGAAVLIGYALTR
jgi:undecaprenyl-diphosphatase